MAEIVNLRMARKKKRREEKQARARANRARFGQPKALRDLAGARREKLLRHVENHRLPSDEDGEGKKP